MFKKLKYKLIAFILIACLFCCSEEESSKENISECRQLTYMIEDCMNLHRGALNYLDSCGSLDLDQAKTYDTCEELLEYVGLERFKN